MSADDCRVCVDAHQSLKTATSILLQSPVPIALLWGEDGVMVYNSIWEG